MEVDNAQLRKILIQKFLEEKKKIKERINKHFFWFAEWFESERYGDFFTRDKPHLVILSMLFDLIDRNIIHKFTASLSPRGGKSYSTSLAILWQLCKHPYRANMRNSYTANLAVNILSYFVRECVKDERIYQLYGIQLSPTSKGKDKWMLANSLKPSYSASGIGGSSSGVGVDNWNVLDDEYSGMGDAMSKAIRQQTNNWVGSVHLARMEKGSKEMYLCTRWTRVDHIGQIEKFDKIYRVDFEKYFNLIQSVGELDDEKFEEIYKILENEITANVDENTFVMYSVPALIKNEYGEEVSYSPSQFSTQTYIEKRESYRRRGLEWIWEAVYMQDPSSSETKIFEKLNRFSFLALRERLRGEQYSVVSYIDPAFEKGGDNLAMAVAIFFDDYLYMIDAVYNNSGSSVTIPKIVSMIKKYKIGYVEYELNNGGERIISKVINLLKRFSNIRLPQFKGINNTKEKTVRIALSLGDISERVKFLKENEYPENNRKEYAKFVDEILESNLELDQDYDDAIDCASGLVSIKALDSGGSRFIEF